MGLIRLIRERLTARMDKLRVAIAKHEDRIEGLEADTRDRRDQDLISIGSSVLGSILGGRNNNNTTTTIARSAGRAATRGRSSAQRIAPRRTASRSRTWPSGTLRMICARPWPRSTRSGTRRPGPSSHSRSAWRRTTSAWTRWPCCGCLPAEKG